MVRALVCPGQGAQSIGMGKLLADEYSSAKAVFEEVDDALGENPVSYTHLTLPTNSRV